MTTLKLDAEGRYLIHPRNGMRWPELLERGTGATRIDQPTAWPPTKGGVGYVATVDNVAFVAALWVRDRVDFERVRATRGRDVDWFEVPINALLEADANRARKARTPQAD